MQKIDKEVFEDLARGCIYGALCGDAIGAPLKYNKWITEQDVIAALKLSGGGVFNVGSGQITDDGELTLCLGQALVEGNGALDLNTIASYYGKWFISEPFDVGKTIKNAASQVFTDSPTKTADWMRKGAQLSKESQSCGALMRISPLCVWASKLKKDQLVTAVGEEAKLTHPNQTAIHANIAFAYAIQHLLNNKGDHIRAFEKCKEMAIHLQNDDIINWINEVSKDQLPSLDEKQGWLKIAFCYAFYHLKEFTSFHDAMEDMLTKGRDTDTNCCIVGAMMGALHGFKGIPKEFVDGILGFSYKKEERNGLKRPDFLVPGEILEKTVTGVMALCPKELVMIGKS